MVLIIFCCCSVYRLFFTDPGIPLTALVSRLHADHPGGRSVGRHISSGAGCDRSFSECQSGYVCHCRQVIILDT